MPVYVQAIWAKGRHVGILGLLAAPEHLSHRTPAHPTTKCAKLSSSVRFNSARYFA